MKEKPSNRLIAIMSETLKTKIYFPNLNGLRFWAAFSVIIYHAYGIEVLNGHFGVILFFVLSGFLITTLLIEEKLATGTINIPYFFIRRCLRIWPLYFFIILISFVAFVSGYNDGREYSYSSFTYYLLFVPNAAFVLDIGIPLAGILWSVGSEEQFYILWPFIVKYTNRFLWLVLLFFVLFYFVSPIALDYVNAHFLNGQNKAFSFTSNLMLRQAFNCMATGALVAYLYKKKPGIFKFIFSTIFQILLVSGILTLWFANYFFTGVDQAFAVLFALLIANLALNPKTVLNFENKVFNFLGKISYGLYVYHLIAFALTKELYIACFKSPINVHILFILGTFFTIGISALSYEYFEKHFLKVKNLRYTIIKSGNTSN